MKRSEDVMEILEAYDLLQSYEGAARLAGCDPETVKRYVMERDLGGDVAESVHRAMLIDPFLDKVEEWVDRSKGRVRADVVHRKLEAMGYSGSERTTRRAVAEAKQAWAAGHRRIYRPWIPEPGMWFQWDWGDGPDGEGPQDLPVVRVARLEPVPGHHPHPGPDPTHRGGLPGRHGAPVLRCPHVRAERQRADGDLRPGGRRRGAPPRHRGRRAPLRDPDPDLHPGRSRVQGRLGVDREDRQGRPGPHRGQPAGGLRLVRRAGGGVHGVLRPGERTTPSGDPPRSVRGHHRGAGPVAPGPDRGSHAGVRQDPPGGAGLHHPVRILPLLGASSPGRGAGVGPGPGRTARRGPRLALRSPGGGPARADHAGTPRIEDAHYPQRGNPLEPKIRPATAEERAFLSIGEGARSWLVEAAAAGATRIRAKMRRATELSQLVGGSQVDRALGLAATAGRFAEADLASILEHLRGERRQAQAVLFAPEEELSTQPGTGAWGALGR